MEYKTPSGTLDYLADWSTWLAQGDSIASSAWSVESGLTVDSETSTTTTATAIISGGVAGRTYQVQNTIVTSNGLDSVDTFFVKIQHRIE